MAESEKEWTRIQCGCSYRITGLLDKKDDGSGSMPMDLELNPDCPVNHDAKALQDTLHDALRSGLGILVHGDMTDGDCPICLNWIPNNDEKGEYPGAMSRFDDEIEVCSGCGGAEAMLQYNTATKQIDEGLVMAMNEHWELWRSAVLIQRDMLKIRGAE